jgi:signal transduction histidine kinase
VMAQIDANRIEQVLVNLLDNALKFSPPGAAVELTLTEQSDGGVSVSVTDHGPGAPPEQRARLFERFSQARTAGFQGGLGLGLYLSKHVVERHGGIIEAHFPPAGGSRFSFTLPRFARAG